MAMSLCLRSALKCNLLQWLGPQSCLCVKRGAGHSKWANIRHIKALKDGQKCQEFTRLSRLIQVAIQEGGSADPALNIRLAQIIEQARKVSMPAASISNAIRKSTQATANAKSYILDLKGPSGSCLLVFFQTDNITKSKQTLNAILRKTPGFSLSSGGWHHLFEHKGVIEAETKGRSSEETFAHAVELGAEDVLEVDGSDVPCTNFMCAPEELRTIRDGLLQLGYTVRSCECEYIPQMRVALSDTDLKAADTLYKRLEDHPDVVNVTDNIVWD